jgi:hypothetical protein
MRDDLVPGRTFPDLRLPEQTGQELSLSQIADGQRADGRVAVHLRKGGQPDRSPLAKHHITAPK